MSLQEMRARSENISLGGILLSSAVPIPEGSTVEIAVGVKHLPDPGILLNARGKVLRVDQMPAGDFAVAIKLDHSFRLPISRPKSSAASAGESTREVRQAPRGLGYQLAWHAET